MNLQVILAKRLSVQGENTMMTKVCQLNTRQTEEYACVSATTECSMFTEDALE